MTRLARLTLARRKLRQAERLFDAAHDHWVTGDEVVELEAGRWPLSRPQGQTGATRH